MIVQNRTVRVREVISLMKRNGWYQLPGKATGHRQFKHPRKPGRVTIAGAPGAELPPGTLHSVLKQAQLGLAEPERGREL